MSKNSIIKYDAIRGEFDKSERTMAIIKEHHRAGKTRPRV